MIKWTQLGYAWLGKGDWNTYYVFRANATLNGHALFYREGYGKDEPNPGAGLWYREDETASKWQQVASLEEAQQIAQQAEFEHESKL